MPRFDWDKSKELKEFLHESCIHDSKVECMRYKFVEDSLIIEAFNPIFNVKIIFTFRNVKIALFVRGNGIGSCDTILSLTVEDDFSYLHNYILKHVEGAESHLYLLFQMFSGDELHILSKEVTAEVIR